MAAQVVHCTTPGVPFIWTDDVNLPHEIVPCGGPGITVLAEEV